MPRPKPFGLHGSINVEGNRTPTKGATEPQGTYEEGGKMNPSAYSLPSSSFHRSNSRPAEHGTKRLLGSTALLLSLLLGSSAFAQVTLTPPTLALGNQAVNQSSAAISTTLKNTQAAPLTISSIAISGGSAPADYVAGGNCPLSPSTLSPGENCRITVTFTPSAPGLRTATLTVRDDAATSPLTVALTGTGVAAVELTPSRGNFGLVAVGDTSATEAVTITNGTPTPSGVAPSEDLALRRLGPLTLPRRAPGSPGLAPLIGAGNTAQLVSIAVTPANLSIAPGNSQQFTATGFFAGGNTENLTASVLWTASAPGVATINASGLVSSVALGSATITATWVTAAPSGPATGVAPGTPIINLPPPAPLSGSTTF